jgi:hypothetical protein
MAVGQQPVVVQSLLLLVDGLRCFFLVRIFSWFAGIIVVNRFRLRLRR